MSRVTFADVVHQLLDFSTDDPAERMLLELADSPWFQRLRDISQTANTRLVYMFSEHSRFGHCLGVAYLAKILMARLAEHQAEEVLPYRAPVLAAALLHDIGHLAPGSHTAFKTWFPEAPDTHEELSVQVIRNDEKIMNILGEAGDDVLSQTCAILEEQKDLPPWTWEIISGGGWNVDRGNWCVVDSILAGVTYGKYNIPALTEAMIITEDRHLALNESRLDAMMHFALSRHAMYRQIYQHRVLLSSDMLNKAIVLRARETADSLSFADHTMREALAAKSPADLSLPSIFCMRESWWKYHLSQWRESKDAVLADLCDRLLHRRLFKTVRLHGVDSPESLWQQAKAAVEKAGYDPRYYLHEIVTSDVHEGDYQRSMLVRMDDGRVRHLSDAEPLFNALVKESRAANKRWLVMPEEAKILMGRSR